MPNHLANVKTPRCQECQGGPLVIDQLSEWGATLVCTECRQRYVVTKRTSDEHRQVCATAGPGLDLFAKD